MLLRCCVTIAAYPVAVLRFDKENKIRVLYSSPQRGLQKTSCRKLGISISAWSNTCVERNQLKFMCSCFLFPDRNLCYAIWSDHLTCLKKRCRHQNVWKGSRFRWAVTSLSRLYGHALSQLDGQLSEPPWTGACSAACVGFCTHRCNKMN